jgi:hypothetical protein
VKLDLAFRAETMADAKRLAEVWIAAEPSVESGRIVDCVAREQAVGPGGRFAWVVTVELVMRSDYAQQSLGLSA